jgi:hypothetical protein
VVPNDPILDPKWCTLRCTFHAGTRLHTVPLLKACAQCKSGAKISLFSTAPNIDVRSFGSFLGSFRALLGHILAKYQ